MLRVLVATDMALYIAYRTRAKEPAGYDGGLQQGIDNAVWLHQYSEVADLRPSTSGPELLAYFPSAADPSYDEQAVRGRPFRYNLTAGGGGIQVAVDWVNGTAAQVTLCRFTVQNEGPWWEPSCYDGVDNDW
ncbi:hypothetical protein GPECTOR_27g673 [Gonium pectorale]|uniref:Uncharacterized protein n=1 Tax=Gonium pectorale TaxID=33097 RepID=A0A150GFE4_GONPE|nr:hypothetical protein GPECTOR_27g673 [Gonium pectorale]|eukprot:KXZ48503.1 hypothetical protein GPECTOR_27g673 [Gonium pectorale]